MQRQYFSPREAVDEAASMISPRTHYKFEMIHGDHYSTLREVPKPYNLRGTSRELLHAFRLKTNDNPPEYNTRVFVDAMHADLYSLRSLPSNRVIDYSGSSQNTRERWPRKNLALTA